MQKLIKKKLSDGSFILMCAIHPSADSVITVDFRMSEAHLLIHPWFCTSEWYWPSLNPELEMNLEAIYSLFAFINNIKFSWAKPVTFLKELLQ